MMEAKIFQSGNSNVVRTRNEFPFNATPDDILQRPDEVLLKQIPKNLGVVFELFANMPSDFLAGGRDNAIPKERESFE